MIKPRKLDIHDPSDTSLLITLNDYAGEFDYAPLEINFAIGREIVTPAR